MAKNEGSSNRPIVKAAGTVNVFNTGTRQVGVAIRVHNNEPRAVGKPVRGIRFLPGNNEVDSEDWEKCKKSKTVQSWLSSIDQLDQNGTLARARILVEGKVDQRFDSTSTVLSERMYAYQRVMQQEG